MITLQAYRDKFGSTYKTTDLDITVSEIESLRDTTSPGGRGTATKVRTKSGACYLVSESITQVRKRILEEESSN